MLYTKIIFLIAFTVSQVGIAMGQVAKSYFSNQGIGELYTHGVVQNQGMGGIGISNANSWYINNLNPALLTANYTTCFQAGVLMENRTSRDGSVALTNFGGNLSYLAIAFPINPGKWTTALGLMPYSSMNYKISSIQNIEGSNDSYTAQETGSGGINHVYWSNGVRVHKNIAVGAQLKYLFSSIISEKSSIVPQAIYFPLTYDRTYLKGFGAQGGIYLHKDSLFRQKKYQINIGATYDIGAALSTLHTLRIEKRTVVGNNIVDSTTLANNQPGNITLPHSYGLGISVGNMNHWLAGIDLTVLDYSFYKRLPEIPTHTTTGFRSSVGFEITPDPTRSGRFFKRTTYRTGISYEQTPYLTSENKVKDWGVSCGISMPMFNGATMDLSVKIGKRGNFVENIVEETYLKLYFGITFNDRWFIRRKFD